MSYLLKRFMSKMKLRHRSSKIYNNWSMAINSTMLEIS
jgi:hypothetical protein